MKRNNLREVESKIGKRLNEYYIEHDIRKIMILKNHNAITIPGKYIKKMKDKYPYIEFNTRNRIIFFSKEEYKGTFKNRLKENKYGEMDFTCELLGEYLGYPPTAVEWYVDNTGNIRKEPGEVVDVWYKGIPFTTHKDLVKENIEWMDKNLNISETLGLGIMVRDRK